LASGEWFNFLDDDDLFFADHVEVLVQSALKEKVRGVYALAWETATRVLDDSPLKYMETHHHIRHRQPFCRITLWHHNYMPIQSVLFHRSLYEKWGGFEEDMDQLEDWNLWTRYTLKDDFFLVEKCTSKYRITDDFREQVQRQKLLDIAYNKAVEKQRHMAFTSTMDPLSDSIRKFIDSQHLIMVTTEQMHRMTQKYPITRPVFDLTKKLVYLMAHGGISFLSEPKTKTILRNHAAGDNRPVHWHGSDETIHPYEDWELLIQHALEKGFALPLKEDKILTANPLLIKYFLTEYFQKRFVFVMTREQIRGWFRRFLILRIAVRRLAPAVKKKLGVGV
jgi:hypothetical protein